MGARRHKKSYLMFVGLTANHFKPSRRRKFDSSPTLLQRVTQLVECVEKRILLGILTAITHSMLRTVSAVRVRLLCKLRTVAQLVEQ